MTIEVPSVNPNPHLAPFPEGWEPTRATLHAYARGVAAIPRAYANAHPRWWHASLKPAPTGLVTDSVPMSGGGSMRLRMDLVHHEVVVETGTDRAASMSLLDAGTASEFTDALLSTVAPFGVGGEVDRSTFENEDVRIYEPNHAAAFWHILAGVATVLDAHRASLGESTSPVQLWPHGFDMAFEWFGTRTVTSEENGVAVTHPAQINFGFYPAGDAYFYSNPWPFDTALVGEALPGGAVWHTDGWMGTMLPYAALTGRDDAGALLTEYYQAVFDTAAPYLIE